MTIVALSAAYGAAGSQIGPALAERLGVPFVDRGIALAVAERLEVPVREALAHEEPSPESSNSLLERLLSGFVGAYTGAPAPLPARVVSSPAISSSSSPWASRSSGFSSTSASWSSTTTSWSPPTASSPEP